MSESVVVRDIRIKAILLDCPERQAQEFKEFLSKNKVTQMTLVGDSGDRHTTLFKKPATVEVEFQ